MHDARAFWVAAPGRGEIRARTRCRRPSPDEVVVRALYSGISRGTEALVFQRPRAAERIRAHARAVSGRRLPGAGQVRLRERRPCRAAARASCCGRHVFVLYPHQTRYVVPAQAVHVLPDDVPPARAVLAANLETAINGVWDARPHVGDRVAVSAPARSAAWSRGSPARIPGCEVELVDVNPAARSVARALGVALRRAGSGRARTPTSSSTPAARRPAWSSRCALAGFEATIVELSWYGDQAVPLPLGEAFHARRLTLKSSQVGTRRRVAARALGHAPADAAGADAARRSRRSTC